MKIILFLLFLIVVFSSCQQIDLEFSCDPVINNFVLENHEELSEITLDEFLNYSLSMQKAIFNSWSASKKRDVWIEKLERVAERETFSSEEIEYIQQLIEHIHSYYFFKENLDNEKEIRTQFAKQWIEEVKNNLEWTDEFIAFLVYRLYTNENQFENELSELKSLEKSVSTSSECACNIFSDYCNDSICFNSGCYVGSGCGWLWSMDCNGSCS